jgi:hypothetical protein
MLLAGGGIREWGILDGLAISWDSPLMWSIFWALGHGMLKFVKGILYIAKHGQVHMFVLIIPFQSDTAVEPIISFFVLPHLKILSNAHRNAHCVTSNDSFFN